MPRMDCVRYIPHSRPSAPDMARDSHTSGRRSSLANLSQIAVAGLAALVGLIFALQPAAAGPGSGPASAEASHRIYLPMVSAEGGPTSRATNKAPQAAINVAALASTTCGEGDAVPVSGARITVTTNSSSRIALTDQTGYAVFSATAEPAVIQIEWPLGLLPCPNSKPAVELPSGSGEVQFTAVVGQ